MKKTARKSGRSVNSFPKGWDEKRVQAVLNHYENQPEDEAAAEDEAAFRNDQITMMAIPAKLVPAVRKFIAKQAS